MINLKIRSQPDDSTCGPTCLHAVYRYYNDDITLQEVIDGVKKNINGGTLAPLLGLHALQRGYDCTIHPYNIYIFDPSWFYPEAISSEELIAKLELQHPMLEDKPLIECSLAHIAYLKNGGKIAMVDMNSDLIDGYIKEQVPILTGVSATWLYQCQREIESSSGEMLYDDVKGYPTGHFVVLHGFDKKNRSVIVADPLKQNPAYEDKYYRIPMNHLVTSMMLGVLTNDANILVIRQKKI